MGNESKAMYMMSSYHRIAIMISLEGKRKKQRRKGKREKERTKYQKYYYICPKLIYFVNKN